MISSWYLLISIQFVCLDRMNHATWQPVAQGRTHLGQAPESVVRTLRVFL
jgi:hypothetical protein